MNDWWQISNPSVRASSLCYPWVWKVLLSGSCYDCLATVDTHTHRALVQSCSAILLPNIELNSSRLGFACRTPNKVLYSGRSCVSRPPFIHYAWFISLFCLWTAQFGLFWINVACVKERSYRQQVKTLKAGQNLAVNAEKISNSSY